MAICHHLVDDRCPLNHPFPPRIQQGGEFTNHYDTKKQRTDGISLFFLKVQKLGIQSVVHLKFDFDECQKGKMQWMQQMLKLAQWLFWRMRTMLWGGNASPGNRPSRSREDLVLGTLGDPPCEYCCQIDTRTLFLT